MATSGGFSTSYYKNLCMQVTWEVKSQSIENNTTTIAWSLKGARNDTAWGYITCGAFKVVINGVTVYSKPTDYRIDVYNDTEIANGELTIAHEADGSKSFSASAEAAIYYSYVNVSGNDTFTLEPIPRKSTLSADDGTLGTEQTLTIERYSTSFRHTITYTCGSASGTVCDKSSDTSIQFTPPLDLAEQNTSGVSVKIVLTTITYNGSTEIGRTEKTIVCAIPESVKPTCSLSVSDDKGYLSTYGGYVKGQSTFKVDVTSAGSYGSTITSIRTIANGETHFEASFTTDVIKTSGTQTISVTVTDSRGRTGTASVNVTVLDYAVPRITALFAVRCNSNGTANEQGEYVKVIFSSAVTSLSSKNTATYTLKYKVSTASAYTSVTLTAYNKNYAVSNGSYIFAAGTGSSYDITLVLADAFKQTSSDATAPTAFALMHWKADGTAVGIGKVAEKSYTLDMGVDIELNDNELLKNGVPAFAPAGFGLGTTSNDRLVTTPEQLDTLLTNGWFIYAGGGYNPIVTTGGNINYAYGRVDAFDSTEAKMTLIPVYLNAHNTTLERYYSANGWSEFGWKNPLMVLGVEYRTTEQWQGKPVYTMLVDCGTFPNRGQKIITFSSASTKALRCVGQTDDGGTIPSLTYGNRIDIMAYINSIFINTTYDVSVNTATAQVWYLKD